MADRVALRAVHIFLSFHGVREESYKEMAGCSIMYILNAATSSHTRLLTANSRANNLAGLDAS